MIRRWFGLAAFIIMLIAAGTQIAYAFEEVTVYVTGSYNQVTFTVSDPRALQHIPTAVLVTREGFETEVLVVWEQDETSPAYNWTWETDQELGEIYFLSDIPLLWSITGPWEQNGATNGIVRKPQLFTRLPLIANN